MANITADIGAEEVVNNDVQAEDELYFEKLSKFIQEKSKEEVHLQNTERGEIFSSLSEYGTHQRYLRQMLLYYISSANEVMETIKPRYRKTKESPLSEAATKSIIDSIECVIRDNVKIFEEEGGQISKEYDIDEKKIRKQPPPISHSTMLSFKLNFLNYAKTLKFEFIESYIEISSRAFPFRELEIIFNFLVRSTYEFGNLILSGKILVSEQQDYVEETNDIEAQFEDFPLEFDIPSEESLLQNALPLKKPEFTNENLLSLDLEQMQEESPNMLYRIGGGTMRQIVNVSKVAKDNNNFSKERRIRERNLFNLGISLSCHGDEKFALPIDLRVRDNGNMSFPKLSFLEFLRKVNNEVRKYACEYGFRKFGTRMIKECKENILEQMNKIWFLFCDCLPKELKSEDETVREFFKIWVRKLVNARIQEFISNHNDLISNEMKKLAKGGQTLRDGLYASVSNTKRKGIPKEKKSRKKRDDICDLTDTINCDIETKVTNNVEINISKPPKVKKSRQFVKLNLVPSASTECIGIESSPTRIVEKKRRKLVPDEVQEIKHSREKGNREERDYYSALIDTVNCDREIKATNNVEIDVPVPKVKKIRKFEKANLVPSPSTESISIESNPTKNLETKHKKVISEKDEGEHNKVISSSTILSYSTATNTLDSTSVIGQFKKPSLKKAGSTKSVKSAKTTSDLLQPLRRSDRKRVTKKKRRL